MGVGNLFQGGAAVKQRDYNAIGLLRLAAAAAELVPMIVNGTPNEVQDAIAHLYNTAREEFPSGPRGVRDALNAMCSELDLPTIFTATHRDSGEIL
jgi:hypothetical protein